MVDLIILLLMSFPTILGLFALFVGIYAGIKEIKRRNHG